MNEREFTEILLEKRKIYLYGDINEEYTEKIIKLLMLLDAKDEKKEITLYINSTGGEVKSGIRLYRFIKKMVDSPVKGIVIGSGDSMALVVLQACKKRMALKESTFHLHHLRLEVKKEWDEFFEWAEKGIKSIKNLQEEIFSILTERNDKEKMEIIKKLTKEKALLKSNQALELGLIDEIIC